MHAGRVARRESGFAAALAGWADVDTVAMNAVALTVAEVVATRHDFA